VTIGPERPRSRKCRAELLLLSLLIFRVCSLFI